MQTKQVFNEINITPLTDIFLVLLIIMMVVAPMMQQTRQDIKPPKVASGQAVEQGPVTVEVTQAGAFYVDGQPTTDLKAALVSHADKLKEKNVIIRADKTTRSSAVLAVLAAARDARYEKVTVAGEGLSDKRQTELQGQPQALQDGGSAE